MEKIVKEFVPADSLETLQRQKKGQTVVNLGLLWNIVLAVGKTVFGIVGHSTALLSDGINSTSDVAYYIVVKIFMKLAGRPPDPEHPYGHRQMESIAALTVGSFVITTAIAIFWTAVNNVFDQLNGIADTNSASMGALWMGLFTVASKIFLTVYTRAVGEKTGAWPSAPWPSTTAMTCSRPRPPAWASFWPARAIPGWIRWPARWSPC